MKHKLLLLTAFIFTLSYLYSQTPINHLDNLISYISKNGIIGIEFKCEISNDDLEMENVYDGTLLMDTANFRLNIDNLTVISNKDITANYNTDINELTIFSNKDDETILNPFALIFNHKKYFNVNQVSLFKNIITLELMPKTEDIAFNLLIIFDVKTCKISELEVTDNANTKYVYKITKFTPNLKYDHSIFNYSEKEFPGATIIDMR